MKIFRVESVVESLVEVDVATCFLNQGQVTSYIYGFLAAHQVKEIKTDAVFDATLRKLFERVYERGHEFCFTDLVVEFLVVPDMDCVFAKGREG